MTTRFISLLLLAGAAELVIVTWLFLISKKMNNAGLIDTYWGASIASLAFLYAWATLGNHPRDLLGLAMVGLWSLRLGLHIHRRGRGHGEDARYTKLKEQWGARWPVRMYGFYLMQGVAALLFSIPFLAASLHPEPEIQPLEWFAAGLWLIAVLGEATADHQLERFKANPGNKKSPCKAGLWRFSRHPNYFFEWLTWCSFALFAFSAPYGFLALICPVAMYHVLVNVTGIPKAEEQSLRSRGDAYRQYQKETNAFFPWFPKKAA